VLPDSRRKPVQAFAFALEDTMRGDAMNSSGGCDGAALLPKGALKFAAGLALALLLSVATASAQSGDKARPTAAAAARDAATSAQTRSRRVVAAGASAVKNEPAVKKDEGGKLSLTETSATTAETKTAAETKMAAAVETEDEPPAAPAAAKVDRLSALRAQIEDAKDEADRGRLRRTLIDYLVALDRKGEAIDELRMTLKEERFDPVGFFNIGNALVRLGDADTAVEAYRKAIEQRQGHYSRASHNLGVVLLRQGRWDEAQEALTDALRQEAFRYAEASYNLGRLYSLRGEAALAIREWNRALALQPDHLDAALALARAYAEDGDPERAVSIIDSFTKRQGANDKLTAARREILYDAEASDASDETMTAAVVTTNRAPATVTTNRAPATKPANASVAVRTSASSSGGGARVNSSDKADNRASAPKTKASEPVSRPSSSAALRTLTVDRETYDLLERARSAREAGRDAEAVNFYNKALARRGGFFPPANLEASFVLSELNRHEEAIQSLQKLIAKEGARYPIAYFHLGRQYEALGQLAAAATAYSRAVAAYGDKEPQFLLDVSRVREKEGNIEAALAAMEEYARVSGQRGRAPEWTAERIATLRQKKAAAAATTPTSAPATMMPATTMPATTTPATPTTMPPASKP
jgi:tetratricopeptide (TPR) repeat protein